MNNKGKWLIGITAILVLLALLVGCVGNTGTINISEYGKRYEVEITPINNYGVVLYWELLDIDTGERAILAPTEDIYMFDDHIEIRNMETYLVCDTKEGIKVGAKVKLAIGEKVAIEVIVVNPSLYHFNLLMVGEVNKWQN